MGKITAIDKKKLPQHIAIIMDGNGRWAKQQGLMRVVGHENGTKSVREVVEACAELGVKYLTLYAFSTENWNRPKLEVQTLMKLLVKSLKKEIKTLQDNNIRLSTIGNIQDLPKKVHRELHEVIAKTKDNMAMDLTLALSYGSREELISVVKELSHKVKNNIISVDSIDESIINKHLYTQNLPDVDLLIRTSGEQRISNFLLWQIAYAELYFTPILWPDFKKADLYDALIAYQNRERRFGKTSEQLS
ncbi:MAG TPA: isoprenyl transferase [Aquaticitalea sp.]|nr:isoprenyl transferase [Aquaticitalea sp.]